MCAFVQEWTFAQESPQAGIAIWVGMTQGPVDIIPPFFLPLFSLLTEGGKHKMLLSGLGPLSLWPQAQELIAQSVMVD